MKMCRTTYLAAWKRLNRGRKVKVKGKKKMKLIVKLYGFETVLCGLNHFTTMQINCGHSCQ